MRRFESWPILLSDFIEDRRNKPFQWGQNDCCLFVADWILLCTGVDFAKDARGTYSTEFGAKRTLTEMFGENNPAELSDDRLEKIPSQMAKRGDIVALQIDGVYSLGICVGAKAAFIEACPEACGLIFVPLKQAVMAWSV